MGIKEFSKATLKLSLSLFVAALALACVAWGIFALRERAEKREAEQYEVFKVWNVGVKKFLDFELTARTKLVDGRMLVAVVVDGHPAYLSHPALEAVNQKAHLMLTFEDADGFKVYEKAIQISDFSTTVDGKGRKIGLDHQFDDRLTVSQYKSFSRATLQWTLKTEIPAPPKAAESPRSDTSLDHCAPNLSRAERLSRLAKHGVVRQTGPDSFSVGYRDLSFFSADIGGGLLSCR